MKGEKKKKTEREKRKQKGKDHLNFHGLEFTFPQQMAGVLQDAKLFLTI